MTSRRDLTRIIDRCLDDLVAGRASVSDCLERYPDDRAALEPVLRAAATLQALPRRAERSPNRIRRAALMELIRATPQQRRHWWLPGAYLPRFAAAATPIALVAMIGVFLLATQPATPAAAATLTVFAGAAEEQVDGAWRPLAEGATVRQGTRLRTNAKGHALLTFPDGSTGSLQPSTEIAIEQLTAGRPRAVQIRQYSGRLWNDVVIDRRPGAKYEVHTQDASVQVQGTVFETANNDGETLVTSVDGTVDVVSGNDRVSLPRGETVRAQAQRLSDWGASPRAGNLVIDAPFAAALLSERGEATGARPDGATFHQIRGVTTSNPGEGPQRFDFEHLEPGTYTLMLQRFGQGLGSIVIDVGGTQQRVPIDDSAGVAEVRVRVEMQDGKPRVVLAEDRPWPAPAAERPPIRIVETERTKKANNVAAQRAAAEKKKPQGGPQNAATPAIDAFAAQLRAAALRNDAAAIRGALQEIASASGANNASARMRILVALLNNRDAANRVAAALTADPVLRTKLLDRAGTLPTDQQERLRRALLGESREGKGPRAPSSGTSSPTRTPTAGRDC